MLAQSCGGAPGSNAEVDRQFVLRSAGTYLGNARSVPLDINTGIHDGHIGAVPIMQSLNAFNMVAAAADKLTDEDIASMTEREMIPEHLGRPPTDSLYGKKSVLFRRISENVRITVFEGGHELLYQPGLSWLEQQAKGRPPKWDISPGKSGVVSGPDLPLGK